MRTDDLVKIDEFDAVTERGERCHIAAYRKARRSTRAASDRVGPKLASLCIYETDDGKRCFPFEHEDGAFVVIGIDCCAKVHRV